MRPARKSPWREHHVDEQMGLIVLVVIGLFSACVWLGAGWVARGFYEDRVARQTLGRLCDEGVLCAELAE